MLLPTMLSGSASYPRNTLSHTFLRSDFMALQPAAARRGVGHARRPMAAG